MCRPGTAAIMQITIPRVVTLETIFRMCRRLEQRQMIQVGDWGGFTEKKISSGSTRENDMEHRYCFERVINSEGFPDDKKLLEACLAPPMVERSYSRSV